MKPHQVRGDAASSRIRVVQVIEATAAGTRRHILDVCTGLDAARFDVTLVCSLRRNPSFVADVDSLRERGITVHVIPMDRAIRPFSDLVALTRLYRYLRRRGFHVLHAHSSKAGFLGRVAGRMARIPIVLYSPHCFYFQQKRGMERRFLLGLERWAGRLNDAIVAVSEGERRLVIENRIAGAERTVAIPNGVDVTRFDTGPPSAHQAPRIIGTVSRFDHQKGYEYFIDAARLVQKEFPAAEFVFIGEGHEQERAEVLVERAGLRRFRVVQGPNEETREVIAAFDVGVLSSRWEGLPYGLLEMMASAKPVVASRIAGVDEVVTDGKTGYLVAPGDVAGIATAIGHLLSAPTLAAEMGHAGRRVVASTFTLRAQISRLEELYQSLWTERSADLQAIAVHGGADDRRGGSVPR